MISMGSVLYCYNDVQVTSTFLWVISVLRLQMLHCLPAFLFIPVVRKFQISDPSLISFSLLVERGMTNWRICQHVFVVS